MGHKHAQWTRSQKKHGAYLAGLPQRQVEKRVLRRFSHANPVPGRPHLCHETEAKLSTIAETCLHRENHIRIKMSKSKKQR
mmetsp:Transcript_31721/g.62318  ORF Transcript_31721/g.62318 Transcript_31721/m.62318 type:complete len:81 (+) Transcript_31721:707-949(+)